MEDEVKVVVFHVDVPKSGEIFEDDFISSEEFTIQYNGKTSIWKLKCNLNDRSEDDLAIYLALVSGDVPSAIHCRFALVNYKDSSQNIFFDNNITRTVFLRDFVKNGDIKGGFGPIMISLCDLFEKKDNFFPEDKLRFVARIILKNHCVKPPQKRESLSFRRVYDSMMFNTDVTFQTSDGKKVPAHSYVLCAMSEFFSTYFYVKPIDGKNSKSRVIDAHNYHSDVIKDFIRFIYCEETFENLASAKGKEIELYYAANNYKLEKLQKICLNAIYENLDASNVLACLNFAKHFKLKNLLSCCVLIILANYNSISKSDEWKDLKPKLYAMIHERIFSKSENLINSTWISDDF